MTAFTVRITVRGTFADLSADQRADLLADADAHDILEAEYTREGHLTYERQRQEIRRRQT